MTLNPVIYFLQPMSDQAVSMMRLLKAHHRSARLIAVVDGPGAAARRCRLAGYDTTVISSAALLEDNAVVVPTGAGSTEALLEVRDIRLGAVTLDRSSLRVYDKPWFIAHCIANNLPVPKTYPLGELPPATEFPVFYKQRSEKGGGTRGIARTPSDVPLEELETLILQEFIDTRGTYGVGFLADNGRIRASFSHFEKHSFPKAGGSAIAVEPFKDERLTSLTQEIVGSLEYSGWGLAEFKYCARRKDYLFMEINAKFWASCELTFRSDPRFLSALFGISLPAEHLAGLFFVNRALSAGPLSALALRKENQDFSVVRHPGTIRSFLVGMGLRPLVRRLLGRTDRAGA